MLQAGVADGGQFQVEGLQLGQALEVFQPGVLKMRGAEVQLLKTAHAAQVNQAGAADGSEIEIENTKVRQTLQMLQAGVGNVGRVQAQLLQVGEQPQMNQVRVGDLGPAEINLDHGPVRSIRLDTPFEPCNCGQVGV